MTISCAWPHEVEHFLEEGGAKRRNLGTVLTFSADRDRPMLFQGVFDLVDVGAQTGRTGPGRSVPTDVTSPTGTAGRGGSGPPPARDELRVGRRSKRAYVLSYAHEDAHRAR